MTYPQVDPPKTGVEAREARTYPYVDLSESTAAATMGLGPLLSGGAHFGAAL